MLRFSILPCVLFCVVVVQVGAEEKTKETIRITFVDEDGKPVDKVPCNLIPSQNGPPIAAVKQSSDSNGVLEIELDRLGGPDRGFQFYTFRDHFVNIRCVIHEKYGLWPIPKELNVVLEKGRTIGGTVLDPDGEPVEGAAVRIWFSDGEPKYRDRFTLNATPGQPKTDAQGRWSCDKMPAEFRACSLSVTSDRFEGAHASLQPGSDLTEQAQKGELVLRLPRIKVPRASFKGKVVDEEGRAVAGARVYFELSSPNITTGGRREAKSDEKGVFDVPNWPAEKVKAFFFIVSDGFAPFWMEKEYSVDSEQDEPFLFSLNKGVPIRFRFTDHEGKPAAGVKIGPERYLPDRGYMNIDFRKTVESDADGLAVWQNAPKEALRYRIEPSEKWLGNTFSETAPDKEHEITVYPAVRVTGDVVDAETGGPIDGAEAAYSIYRRKERDGETIEFINRPTPCKDGAFELSIPYYQPKFAVRVSAKGYRHEISEDFLPGRRDVKLRFELKKDLGVSGTVLDVEGKPVEGAVVVLYGGSKNERFYLDRGRAVFRHPYIQSGSQFDPPNGKTDAEGRFTLPTSLAEKVKLFVLHDRGYAVTDPKETIEPLRLNPWCRVEGVLFKGKEPWRDQSLRLALRDFDRFEKKVGFQLWSSGDYSAKTDENGRFHFDRVFPSEEAVLIRQIAPGSIPDSFYERWGGIETVGGETTRVRYGFLGRPVTGRLKVKDEANGPEEGWENANVCLLRVRDDGDDARREHFMNLPFSYVEKVEKDGSFRIESVENGNYRLSVRVRGANDVRHRQKLRKNDEMPMFEVEGPLTEEPFELGELTVKLNTVE